MQLWYNTEVNFLIKGSEIRLNSLFSFPKGDNFELLPCLVKIMSAWLIIFTSYINSKLQVDITLLRITDLHWFEQSLVIFPSYKKSNCLIKSEDEKKILLWISQIPPFLISFVWCTRVCKSPATPSGTLISLKIIQIKVKHFLL